MHTIAVVDDDCFVRIAIEQMLESEGFDVLSFASAEEFLRAFLRADGLKNIDCLLTDVEMPGGMTGIALLAEISERAPVCPVVVMSGRGGGVFRSAAYERGARDYLEKPFSGEKLVEVIHRAIDPAPAPWRRKGPAIFLQGPITQ